MTALNTIEWAVEPPVDAQWELPPDATVMARPAALARVVAVVGPAGAIGSVGPGFKLVGNEIRYDISSLTGV